MLEFQLRTPLDGERMSDVNVRHAFASHQSGVLMQFRSQASCITWERGRPREARSAKNEDTVFYVWKRSRLRLNAGEDARAQQKPRLQVRNCISTQ